MRFQCPKLSPLQSRFFASLLTLVFLGIVYWGFYRPPFAYAAELDVDRSGLSRDGADHNWYRIAQEDNGFDYAPLDDDEPEEQDVEVEVKVKRASLDIDGNDSPNIKNIEGDQTALWFYSNDLRTAAHTSKGPGLPSDPDDVQLDRHRHHAELRRRDDVEERQSDSGTTVYISINTCLQPTWKGSGDQTTAPPQLTLYVSTSDSNTSPGPDQGNDTQTAVPLVEGFANINITAAAGVHMSVHAPSVPGDFEGVWNYELAVSIDGFYHAAEPDNPFLFAANMTKGVLRFIHF